MFSLAELVLTRILFNPASHKAFTAFGSLPFVLMLMLPFDVCFRISCMDSATVFHINKGSPSQPWPKLTIGKGAVSKCGTVYSTISSAVGLNVKRSCVDVIFSSWGWKEIQPIQLALQAGELGTGHSHLPIKKLRAAGQ